MIRWLFVLFIALLVFTFLIPELRKLGVGRVFGDVSMRYRGRPLILPFGSATVLYLVVVLIAEIQKRLL